MACVVCQQVNGGLAHQAMSVDADGIKNRLGMPWTADKCFPLLCDDQDVLMGTLLGM